MGRDNQAYFLQRATEETAAAERSTCVAAANAHRELALRYSLKLILPDPCGPSDEQLVGLPKPEVQQPALAPSRRPSIKRRRA